MPASFSDRIRAMVTGKVATRFAMTGETMHGLTKTNAKRITETRVLPGVRVGLREDLTMQPYCSGFVIF